jgi:hypothetical protein
MRSGVCHSDPVHAVLQVRLERTTSGGMRTITFRVPEELAAEIEAEACARRISKSDVVRERLRRAACDSPPDPLASIRDLIGSVDDDLPPDLSARVDHYLRVTGFGRDRSR